MVTIRLLCLIKQVPLEITMGPGARAHRICAGPSRSKCSIRPTSRRHSIAITNLESPNTLQRLNDKLSNLEGEI